MTWLNVSEVGAKTESVGGWGGVSLQRLRWGVGLASLKSSNPLTSVAGTKMKDHTVF